MDELPRPPAQLCALMIIYAIDQYRAEKEKDVSRLRMSRQTVRLLCCRSTLRESFLADLAEALADLKWWMIDTGEDFAFAAKAPVKKWVRIGSKRVAPVRKKFRIGDPATIAMLKAIFDTIEDDEASEDD